MFRASLESVQVVSERSVTCLADASSANGNVNRGALMFTKNSEIEKVSAKLLGKHGQVFLYQQRTGRSPHEVDKP